MDFYTLVPSKVFNKLHKLFAKLREDMHFMQVMGQASLKGHGNNFMDNLHKGFRLGLGGLTPIWETLVKAAKQLEVQAQRHTEDYLIICRCLWHIDVLCLSLIPAVKAFWLEVP
jgi:hypothetical protein